MWSPAPVPPLPFPPFWQIWVKKQLSPWASCSGQGSLLWYLCSCCWLWMSHVTLSTNAASSCASVANLALGPKDTTWRRGRQLSCEPQCQTNPFKLSTCWFKSGFVLIYNQIMNFSLTGNTVISQPRWPEGSFFKFSTKVNLFPRMKSQCETVSVLQILLIVYSMQRTYYAMHSSGQGSVVSDRTLPFWFTGCDDG